jgi:hypothetical protein
LTSGALGVMALSSPRPRLPVFLVMLVIHAALALSSLEPGVHSGAAVRRCFGKGRPSGSLRLRGGGAAGTIHVKTLKGETFTVCSPLHLVVAFWNADLGTSER